MGVDTETPAGTSLPLRCGIPSLTEYNVVLGGELFADIQNFSTRFLHEDHHRTSVFNRWPADPLHTYNRQWEYPFAASHLAAWRQKNSRKASSSDVALRALDFGSGYTFFPWYLAQLSWNVTCYDVDDGLRPRFAARADTEAVQLMIGDGTKIPYGDANFDVVYSLSVLEHVTGRSAVLGELLRVLRPAGLLILTFDVGLEPGIPIPVPEAQTLVAEVGASLGNPAAVDNAIHDLRSVASDKNARVTSRWARAQAPQLLPWRLTPRGILGSLARLQWPRPPFQELAFCCLAATRLV